MENNTALTCNNPHHKAWYAKYIARFRRLTYPGVRRVLRRQEANSPVGGRQAATDRPTLSIHSNLPMLGQTPGDEVVHTFNAKKIYCLQTVQWACGVPIGWGKCYRSESMPQVLKILDNIWEGAPLTERPGFIAYDDACGLLRHIVTQDALSSWLSSTKFIVNAWHYIGHQAADVLCRTWCNPAPENGTQPDLIRVEQDEREVPHVTRAFNTETAEQFNSWLRGFEALLTQMTATNYDFVVHVLMLLYTEITETRIRKQGQELTNKFWDEVEAEV